MMKRKAKALIGMILAAGLFAGCGTSTSSTQNSASSVSETTQASQTASASESESDGAASAGSGKTLVVYYSATGNTKAVAETIANAANADIFEITPTEPYSDDDLDWTDDNSRVVKEHEDEALQDEVELTTTTVDGWDSYDTVFFGYPIWWGNAAWPVNQFVQNNDFSGKTVIPFCTSSSSGIGDSGTNLAEMAGTGDWQEGQRFSSSPDESEVTSWVQSVLGE